MSRPQDQTKLQQQIDLKNPELAALLAWLMPGLGHLYQGRIAKACLFFVCIMSTFIFGVYLSSSNEKTADGRTIGVGRVVYFSWRADDKRLQYFCQVGVGLPALPALGQAYLASHGKQVLCGGFMAPPRDKNIAPAEPNSDQPSAHGLHSGLKPFFDLATAYTMIAGLLNILAIYDAWGGPVFVVPPKDDDPKDDDPKDGDPKDGDPKDGDPKDGDPKDGDEKNDEEDSEDNENPQ